MTDRQLVSVEEGAYKLGISSWTLRSWAYKGRIASVKLSTRLLFDVSELQRLIAEGERPRTTLNTARKESYKV